MKTPLMSLLIGFSVCASAQTIVNFPPTAPAVPRPLSVASAPPRQASRGHYEWRTHRVWVPPQQYQYVDEWGRQIYRIVPGYYEWRQVRVWVPEESPNPAARSTTPVPPDRPGWMHPMNTWRHRP